MGRFMRQDEVRSFEYLEVDLGDVDCFREEAQAISVASLRTNLV